MRALYPFVFIFFQPNLILAFDENRSQTSIDQPSMTIEQAEALYENLQKKYLSPKQFVEGIEALQSDNIWNMNHIHYLKDILENELFFRQTSKELRESMEILEKYCKILFLFRDELADSYSQYFDRCPSRRISLQSPQRQQDIKIEGVFFEWNKPISGEFLDFPHIIQFTNSNKTIVTDEKPLNFVYEFNSKRKFQSIDHSNFQKLVERINETPPNFYERNKFFIWTALGLFMGATFVSRSYEINF
jgi:hypothetical protein